MTTWLNASFEMRFRLIGGLTVRFAVSQEQTDHALLLSPWPESLLAFEPVWWRLAKRAQLVAMDLPGFGHSQHSDSLLSPRAMGEFIIVAADSFGLEHPHVVAPGTGTAAALFAAARHPGRAAEPSRRQRCRRGAAPGRRDGQGHHRGPGPGRVPP